LERNDSGTTGRPDRGGELEPSATVGAVLRTYRQLRRHGECRASALRAARRVLRHHEPALSDQGIAAIVGALVAPAR